MTKQELKNEFIKAMIAGATAGLVTGLTIILGVRSAYIEVQLEKSFLLREKAALVEIKQILKDENRNLQVRFDKLTKNYKLLRDSVEKKKEACSQ